MKQYAIYFHDMIEEYNNVDYDDEVKDYVETDNAMLEPEQYERLLNKDLYVRFMESYGRRDDLPERELHFECWLIYEAEDDLDAAAKAEKVLQDNGYDWVSVYVIVEMQMVARTVQERGMKPHSDWN